MCNDRSIPFCYHHPLVPSAGCMIHQEQYVNWALGDQPGRAVEWGRGWGDDDAIRLAQSVAWVMRLGSLGDEIASL